ncbi:hypothetical protein, partial [Curtobacterium sp. HSID17257]
MSDQQPSSKSVPARLRGAASSLRRSVARRPVPWIAGGLVGVLVLGSGASFAVAAATMPSHQSAATASATTAAQSGTPR